MRIAIIGTGYVGLVSGACFSDFGHDVVCVDKDAAKIDALEQGVMPIFEPGLDQLVARNVAGGRLSLHHRSRRRRSTAPRRSSSRSERPRAAATAMPTFPTSTAPRARSREALTGPAVVVTKSTVPVGTGDEVERIIREAAPDAPTWVVSNPEFLREGAAIEDFKHPDRIVVGAEDERGGRGDARNLPAALPQQGAAAVHLAADRRADQICRQRLPRDQDHLHQRDRRSVRDGRRATSRTSSRGIGLDSRIGSKFLHAGPGYGGSCFPKDTLALLKTAEDHHAPLRIVEAVVKVNDARKRAMGRKVIQRARAASRAARRSRCSASPSSPIPTTCATRRRSASSRRSRMPASRCAATIRRAWSRRGRSCPASSSVDSPYEAAEGADAVVLVTEWDVLRALDLKRLAATMARAGARRPAQHLPARGGRRPPASHGTASAGPAREPAEAPRQPFRRRLVRGRTTGETHD